MNVSRRQWLQVSGGAVAAGFALGAQRVGAAELKVLRFGVGLKAMSATVINTVIGEVLGYNKGKASR